MKSDGSHPLTGGNGGQEVTGNFGGVRSRLRWRLRGEVLHLEWASQGALIRHGGGLHWRLRDFSEPTAIRRAAFGREGEPARPFLLTRLFYRLMGVRFLLRLFVRK